MVNINKFLIILSILLFNANEIIEARSIKFRNCTNNFNPKYYSNFTIYVLNDRLNMEIDLIRPLVSGLKVKVQFQKHLESSKKYETLFAHSFDVCSAVIAYKETLLKKWLKSLLKNSNIMPNCPVQKGHYYLNAWRMETSLIPFYLRPGDYRLIAYSYMANTKDKEEDFVSKMMADMIIVED